MKGSEEERNVGTGRTKFGIDKYIIFEGIDKGKLTEIRMEIPMSKLMNPEKNKKIRERE